MSASVCVRVHTCKESLGMTVKSADLVAIWLGLKPNCVTLSKSLNLSGLWFPLRNGANNNTYLTGWL